MATKKTAAKKVPRAKASRGAVDATTFLEGLLGGPPTLGEMLHALRAAEELSLVAFAAQLGVSRAHLCDIEKGRRGVSVERAAEWAKRLRVSEERLVKLALQAQVDELGLKLRVEVHAA